jgi:hypothetical protein
MEDRKDSQSWPINVSLSGAGRVNPPRQPKFYLNMSTLTKKVLFLVSQGVIGRHAAEHYARSSDAKVFGAANIDRQDLLNNVLVLAKAAKNFRIPVILTSVESEEFSGNITPQLLDLFPNHTPIKRSSLNSWENKELVAAVKSTSKTREDIKTWFDAIELDDYASFGGKA